MIQGFSTLGAVALRLIEDNNNFGLKGTTRYNLDQAVELVCHRKKTIASIGSAPSYIWWWFSLEEGELHIHFDRGKLRSICLNKDKWDWRMVATADLEPDRLIEQWTPDCWWSRDDRTLSKIELAMLSMGVQPYQKCLTRYTEEWSGPDYFGESDCDTNAELLYVEPLTGCLVAYLPVPLGILGQPVPTMKGLSFA